MLVEAILSLVPKAQFSVWGDEIIWHDERPMPDVKIIKAKAAELEAAKPTKEELEAKRQQILDRLGLTEEEAKLLLG